MRFRRNRRRALKPHKRNSTSSSNDNGMPSITTRSIMAKAKLSKYLQVERSSGNVFADLGLPNPEEHLVKATLALAIARTIRNRGLTQGQAGSILGLAQPKVSDLVRGHLDKFTIDRLMRYLCKLDYDVTISFQPKPKSRDEAVIHVEGVRVSA